MEGFTDLINKKEEAANKKTSNINLKLKQDAKMKKY